MEQKNWFSLQVEHVVQELNSNLAEGLTEEQVNNRLQTYGSNALREAPPRSLFALFMDQIMEPLVLILIIAAIISGILGEMGDTILIMIIVVLNAVLGVFQEHKAEQALKALKAMTKVYVKVMREGKVTQVAAENLVPGDVVLLEAGDSVPADARLLESASLRVNEAAMTGESVPVEKHLEVITAEDVPLGDRKNMVFMGTAVTGGRAKAVITATGMQTELGKIAQMLQEAPPEQTPLQRQLAKLGKTLGLGALVIVVLVFLTGLWRGEELFAMFMTAIALAVAAIPEGLPAVVTIVLALGVTRMSQRQAVIRKLPAVETLGVATYICSDKTGTLTKNEMTVTSLYLYDRLFQVTGSGYQPEGEFYTQEGSKIAPLEEKNLRLLLLGGVLNSDACLEQNDSGYRIIGDPTEGALVVVAAKAGLEKDKLERKHLRLQEIPFDSGRKMMTTFQQIEGELYALTKGAPDLLLARCKDLLTSGGVETLDQEVRARLLEVNKKLALKGQRVLALAVRKWAEVPGKLEPEQVETELTFVGFFALQDPPREEAKEAVAVSRQAGIRTVMITGDHQDTAVAIAQKLDIWRPGDGILTGMKLEKMSQQELEEHVKNTTVYARVSPEHKLRIVDALKANHQVVAMTGDGVNDAPALKRADIGAAMGITGTEVSKEAADMVLLDDNFATIVNAVKEGRTIYDNIRKAVQYLLSCNLGEIVAIFSAILLGMGSPLLPVQILWLNLVTDGAPALALGVEPPEKGIMSRPPRNSRAGIFADGVGQEILLQGLVIGLISFAAYWMALQEGRPLVEAHTMAFLTMAFSQLVHSFNMRSREESVLEMRKNPNRKLILAFIACAFLQLIVIFVPFLRQVFKTAWLQPQDWLIVLALSLSPLVIAEIRKFIKRYYLFKKHYEARN
ncbi:MAG: cation-translocating P-type ATPase [Clostridia bacterium]|nr:cation-translocating P-type ATPase [Clostridia bacterium]